ncbi:MAG: diaminopimelate epimerase [Armatimonadota bacterium]
MIFSKMHGLGNDFVVVNGFTEHLDDVVIDKLAIGACDRNFGIGGDGLILIVPSETADFCMRMLNPDGSEAEMCGNGIRCAAKFAFERGITAANPVRVETLAGLKTIELTVVDGKATAARVDMGAPRLGRSEIPVTLPGTGTVISEPLKLDDRTLNITCVSMGNPHCITFVDDVESYPIRMVGPKVERHTAFPERTNAEFIEVVSPSEIKMRVWERGAGETLACGTGACASAVASILNGKTERSLTVHLKGGDLKVEWMKDDGPVVMTGPAVEVFTGEIPEYTLKAWMV